MTDTCAPLPLYNNSDCYDDDESMSITPTEEEMAEARGRLGARISKYTENRKMGMAHEAALNEAVNP